MIKTFCDLQCYEFSVYSFEKKLVRFVTFQVWSMAISKYYELFSGNSAIDYVKYYYMVRML